MPQDVPIADAQPEEIQELLGGALFKALYKWMIDSGPVYLLPTGQSLAASESNTIRYLQKINFAAP